MQAAFLEAVIDPTLPPPPGLRTWNGSDPAVRFAVYRNNVIVTLTETLASTFPAVKRLVGDEFFAAMAGVFVRAHPARSPILAEYGADFAEFLAGFEPVAQLPYLPDVARLEFAMLRAYHAADATPLGAEALAAAPAEQVGEIRLVLHPSVRTVRSPFAIVTLVEANRAAGDVPPIDAGHPEDALVARPHLDVGVYRLSPGVATFLNRLATGEALGAAAGAASAEAAAFDLQAAIVMLFELGLVVGLSHPSA
jgi:hypothetical protein